MPTRFEHNFQYIQTPSNRLFLIGGGDLSKNLPKLVATFEVINNGTNTFDIVAKDALKHPRHGHSITCLKDKFLVVTGSRLDTKDAHRTCEQYNVDLDIWFDIPSLNCGRHYHSSCTLADRFVYVFCGIANSTKKYCNAIERYDSSIASQDWQLINIPVLDFPERQGAGVS
jgi:hypothetical protein